MKYLKILNILKHTIKILTIKTKQVLDFIFSPEYYTKLMLIYRFNIKYKLRKFFYYGKKYYCPVCDRFIRKFTPFGLPKRDNAECPFCLVMERHRLLFLFLKKKTNIFSAKLKVLDFGPEVHLQKIFRKMNNLDYISTDINPENAMVQMDIQEITFEDCYFDFILCIHVLEHVPDDVKAIKELYRVLKPGGYAIINSPINKNIKEIREEVSKFYDIKTGYNEHMREYGLDYKKKLEEAGFEVEIFNFLKELNKISRATFGLLDYHEDIYLCYKSKHNHGSCDNLSFFRVFIREGF